MAELAFDRDGGTGSVSLSVGETLTLTAEENPTTGFLWQQAGGSMRASLPVERVDFQPKAGAGVGAGGVRTFRVTPERSGSYTLNLELRRGWESEAPRARIEVTLKVR